MEPRVRPPSGVRYATQRRCDRQLLQGRCVLQDPPKWIIPHERSRRTTVVIGSRCGPAAGTREAPTGWPGEDVIVPWLVEDDGTQQH